MLNLLVTWLTQEPVGVWDYVQLVPILLIFGMIFAGLGFLLVGRNPAAAMYNRAKTTVENSAFGSAWKFLTFVIGEEALYRFGGLTLALYLFNNDFYAVIAAAAVISIFFGFMPPHNVLPVRVRIAVAFGGFMLSLIYLKCGGWSSHYAKALIVSTISHLIPSGILSLAFEYDRRMNQS